MIADQLSVAEDMKKLLGGGLGKNRRPAKPRLVSQSGPQFAYADLAFSLKVFRWQTGVWLSGLPINIPQLVGVWRGGRNRRVVGGKRVERG